MRRIFLLAIIALPIMVVLDFTWIAVIANSFYRSQLGYLYAQQTLLPAAAAFYILYTLGLSYFVLTPGVRGGSLKKTLLNAAFFGLVAYGTYDLTSLATTTNWPLLMSIVDMIWGVVCAVVVSALVYWIASKLLKHKELHPMITTNASSSDVIARESGIST